MYELIINNSVTSEDGSEKYCFETKDGSYIEAVYMPGDEQAKICISTQVGCEFGCKHCATAKIPFCRKLTALEIFEQTSICYDKMDKKLNLQILFYGMGEPLSNFDEVYRAIILMKQNINILKEDEQFFISTSGIPNTIDVLSDCDVKVNLAISLHSAIQEKREYLIPHAKIYNIDTMKKDILNYQLRNDKKVILHYCLIKGFNDSVNDINAIAEFVEGIESDIHIIPFNTYDGAVFERPTIDEAQRFVEKLKEKDINIYYRPSRSRDIQGACGQLAAKKGTATIGVKI